MAADARAAAAFLPYLAHALACLEALPATAAVTFLPWRLQLYGLLCRAYDRVGVLALPADGGGGGGGGVGEVVAAARATCDRGMRVVAALRRMYAADPPLLEDTAAVLDAAKAEMSVRKLRYDSYAVPTAAWLAAMAKLLPAPGARLAALVHCLGWGHTGARRVLLPAPPGSEAPAVCRTAAAATGVAPDAGSGTAGSSAAAATGCAAAEARRVGGLLTALMTALRPFTDAAAPAIAGFAASALDAYTMSAAARQSAVAGRTRTSVTSGVALRSALKSPTAAAAAAPAATAAAAPSLLTPSASASSSSLPDALPFPACVAALEASPPAADLPLPLHVTVLRILFSYGRWAEWGYLLHAAEARLAAARLSSAATASEGDALAVASFDCLLMRRVRELAVGTLPVPAGPLPPAEADDAPREAAAAPTKGAASGAAAAGSGAAGAGGGAKGGKAAPAAGASGGKAAAAPAAAASAPAAAPAGAPAAAALASSPACRPLHLCPSAPLHTNSPCPACVQPRCSWRHCVTRWRSPPAPHAVPPPPLRCLVLPPCTPPCATASPPPPCPTVLTTLRTW